LNVGCAIGHVDHGLRPESVSEVERVRDLAVRLGVGFYLKKIHNLSLNQEGLEAAARTARYSALADLAREASATAVATAHTRTDQAETLLLRLFRGAGPGALAGAAELFAEEDELRNALAQRGAHLPPALQRRAFLSAANDGGLRPERHHLETMLRLLERGEGTVDLPGGNAVVKFEPRRPPHPRPAEVAVPAPGRYLWGSRVLEVKGSAGGGVEVDLTEAPFPWTLRARRPGDRFRPGGGRTKKVADLLI